jgi:hypothetical protein
MHESFLNSHVPVNENKSCMRIIYKSWEARVCMRVFSTLMSRSNENKSYMRVDMRVEKREFAWEFSQLSCPGQTRTRVTWELIWELRSESLHESFLNSHVPVKREQELHESWEARLCMRVLSTRDLMSRTAVSNDSHAQTEHVFSSRCGVYIK